MEPKGRPKGELLGDGAFVRRRAPQAGEVPPVGLAQGAAQKHELGLVRPDEPVVAPAPKEKVVLRSDLPPREPEQNKVLFGNPPAPPLDPKDGGLSHTQKAALDFKLKHPGATDAQIAAAAGIRSPDLVGRLLNTPKARLYLSQYLDSEGATLQKAARVVSEAQDAVKETPIAFNGEITDTHRQPDHKVRLDAAKLSMEAHGALEEKAVRVTAFVNLTDAQLAAVAAGHQRVADIIEAETIR